MALAGSRPSTRDRREFSLMRREKVAAAAESTQAMTFQMMKAHQQLGTLAFKQMLAGATVMVSFATSRSAGHSLQQQGKLMRNAISNSAGAASQLTASAARLAHQGLKPIHSRATANAKRLRKR